MQKFASNGSAVRPLRRAERLKWIHHSALNPLADSASLGGSPSLHLPAEKLCHANFALQTLYYKV